MFDSRLCQICVRLVRHVSPKATIIALPQHILDTPQIHLCHYKMFQSNNDQ